MKRYALFTGDDYYPRGGWDDFKGSFDTVEDALAAPRGEWFQVVDLTEGFLVRKGSNRE